MPLFSPPEFRKPGFKLALIACAVAVIVVGMGAFTRLVDAGLGCPDWPTCYGHALWPETEAEVAQANQAFPHAPVEHDKTWPEMVHRYCAESLGLIVIALFIIALKQRGENQPRRLVSSLLLATVGITAATVVVGEKLEPLALASALLTMLVLLILGLKRGGSQSPFKLPAFILAFIVLQGLFGMWTVTLKLWPQVVTLHLLGGFTTLALLWLLTLRYNNSHWKMPSAPLAQLRSLRPWVVGGLIIVALQVALGGWTTSNYAAVACPDLPTCQAEWVPEMDFVHGFNIFQSIGPNYLGGTMTNEGRVAIHYSHRMGALITTIYLLSLVVALLKRVAFTETKTMAAVISAVLVLQISLGLANIWLAFPVYVAVAHNLVGALLLLTMVTLNYKVYTAEPVVGATS